MMDMPRPMRRVIAAFVCFASNRDGRTARKPKPKGATMLKAFAACVFAFTLLALALTARPARAGGPREVQERSRRAWRVANACRAGSRSQSAHSAAAEDEGLRREMERGEGKHRRKRPRRL